MPLISMKRLSWIMFRTNCTFNIRLISDCGWLFPVILFFLRQSFSEVPSEWADRNVVIQEIEINSKDKTSLLLSPYYNLQVGERCVSFVSHICFSFSEPFSWATWSSFSMELIKKKIVPRVVSSDISVRAAFGCCINKILFLRRAEFGVSKNLNNHLFFFWEFLSRGL